MPICIWCKKDKDIGNFGRNISWKNGRNRRCKDCERERGKKFYWNNIEKCRKMSLRYIAGHREESKRKNKEREDKNKDRVFQYYGGYKCACCGETIKKFLTIDHINGGGTKHRKIMGGGGKFNYRWIIKNNFPKGFQVLCMNCNFGKGQNNGICPHKQKENT